MPAMISIRPRAIWMALAAASATAVAVSFFLTEWRLLEACHLCIFQRLLFMLLVVLSVVAALAATHLLGRLVGVMAAAVAALGIGIAAYQSRLQRQAVDSLFSCTGEELGPLERLVEWLGGHWPALFMPSGFCEDPGAVFFGLSLANWTLIVFALCLVAAAWALWLGWRRPV
ncbi:disulfide bond formation protein B [Thiococcus pfennigii]|uniref:disulfide bond formation protein B n=1 Tax=Thiococcus pfennigii TaxID=1057 RepID=UPI0030B8BA01